LISNGLTNAFFGAAFGTILCAIGFNGLIYTVGLFLIFLMIWIIPLSIPYIADLANIYVKIFCTVLILGSGPYFATCVLDNMYSEVLKKVQVRSIVSLLVCWTILRAVEIIPKNFIW